MFKINKELVSELIEKSLLSERKRSIFNIHKEYSDVLQRMLNALNPGTYITPHKHKNPDKREMFIILTGKVLVLEFSDDGNIQEHYILDSSRGDYGAEIAPGIYHSIIPLKIGSVIFEFKDGPYDQNSDKGFAPWAPIEGTNEGLEFNERILKQLNIELD